MRNAFSVMEDWRDVAEDYRELDEHRVLVLSRFTGRGKTSGLQVDQQVAQLFELHAARSYAPLGHGATISPIASV